MLRIMSEEDRLIEDGDIIWYKREKVMANKHAYNFYITTDFATGDKEHNDFSVISVWAYNNNGDWLWVDGICEKQLMDKNVDDLFRLCQEYKPKSVGIEISGQQKGFIPWIQGEMVTRNIFFPLASEGNSNQPGIRPTTKKIERFMVVVPLFKTHKIWLPEDMKQSKPMKEAMNELTLVSREGFKSKHDDFADTISQLSSLKAWKPSQVTPVPNAEDKYWPDEIEEEDLVLDTYMV